MLNCHLFLDRYFQDRPLTHPKVTNDHLILWIFEDYLKKTFWKFVQLLKVLSDDPVVHVRHRMLGFIAELMTSKPEQENTLLELLVNKMVNEQKGTEEIHLSRIGLTAFFVTRCNFA